MSTSGQPPALSRPGAGLSGWTLRDLVVHVGQVQRFWSVVVVAAGPAAGPPPRSSAVTWSHTAICSTGPPSRPGWVSDILLVLFGRVPRDRVRIDGDAAVFDELRSRGDTT